MYLYNASTSQGLRNIARFLTNTNTTTYANADLDASINSYYQMFVNEILAAMDDWDFQGEIATTNLVANQQEYVFPTDILKIKRIEISYDGTNWRNATRFDISDRGNQSDATSVNNEFSTDSPFVDIYDNSLFLYPSPTTNVTGGLKIWYLKEATDLSAATDEPAIQEAYQKGLCYGAAKDWFQKYLEVEGNAGKADRMSIELENYLSKLRTYYSNRDMDRDYILNIADNGFDSEYGYDN